MTRFLLPLLILAFLVGCLDASGQDAVAEPPVIDGELVIEMGGRHGDRFAIDEASVPRGAVVRWVNLGGIHNAANDAWDAPPPSLNDTVVDTAALEPGTYTYVCDAHASVGMRAVLHIT